MGKSSPRFPSACEAANRRFFIVTGAKGESVQTVALERGPMAVAVRSGRPLDCDHRRIRGVEGVRCFRIIDRVAQRPRGVAAGDRGQSRWCNPGDGGFQIGHPLGNRRMDQTAPAPASHRSRRFRPKRTIPCSMLQRFTAGLRVRHRCSRRNGCTTGSGERASDRTGAILARRATSGLCDADGQRGVFRHEYLSTGRDRNGSRR